MIDHIDYKNIEVHYSDSGSKNDIPVILLHGYLESKEIWSGFADELANHYRVICVDLPGHGKSGVYSEIHQMDEMAEALDEIVRRLKLPAFHLVGHSMGGYAALAYLGKKPEMLRSLVLFHSSCYPDTEEKKANRIREIELIRKGKKELLINLNTPVSFATEHLDKHKHEMEYAQKIALQISNAGIISALNGMKARPDRSYLLKETAKPVLLMAGLKDNYIDPEVKEKMAGLNPKVELVKLGESGHMGFMEEKEASLDALIKFFNKH
jgi:pimeloyl-ACP methyl ester carboxylesterase